MKLPCLTCKYYHLLINFILLHVRITVNLGGGHSNNYFIAKSLSWNLAKGKIHLVTPNAVWAIHDFQN